MKKRVDNDNPIEPNEDVRTDDELQMRKPFAYEDDSAFDDMLDNKLPHRPLKADPTAKRRSKQAKLAAKKKGGRFWKRAAVIVLATLGTVFVAAFFFWQWLISGAETGLTAPSILPTDTLPIVQTSDMDPSEPDEDAEPTEGTLGDRPTIPKNTDYLSGIEYNKKLTNILIIGTDSRDASGQSYERSDTMMLLTIDKEEDTIKLTSFQRDILVYLPGRSVPAKLNEANVYGPDYLMQTLNQNFLLNIEHYIMVNIMDAENLVDAIGGLEIEVEDDPQVLSYLNACIIEQNVMYEGWDDRTNWVDTIDEGGLLHLNGRQTIAYARMRKLDSDYQRMSRQREILVKSYDKMKTANLLQLVRLAKAGFDMIATNYTQTELTGMIASLLPAMSADVEQMQVPITGTYWQDNSGAWVNRVNFNMTIPALHEFVYNETMSSFLPVPLVPYTPMEYVGMQYIEMPHSVLTGQFGGLSYVGSDGWSSNTPIQVIDGVAQLPKGSSGRPVTTTPPEPTGPVSSSSTVPSESTSQTTVPTTTSKPQETPAPTSTPTTAPKPTNTPSPTTAAPTTSTTTAPTTTAPTPTSTPTPTVTPTNTPTPTPLPTAAPEANPEG